MRGEKTMSKYTTELRFVCETLAGLSESEGFNSVDTIIENSYTKLFDFDFPIFDEEYRPVLEKKIIRHFYTREIGQETVGLFKLKLQTKLCDIMDYYNQLYRSALLDIDPLTDVSYEKSGSSSESESTLSSLSTSETGSSSTMNSTSMWDMYQDTPQNALAGVENLQYLTNATLDKSKSDGSASSNNEIASTGKGSRDDKRSYLEKFKGYRNSNPSKLLSDYRETFLNIDLMVIGELEELFMQLW